MSPRIPMGTVAENRSVCRLGGHVLHDLAHLDGETHVEHAVRFVEHQHADLAEREGPAAQVVEHPARCSHHDVDASLQRIELPIHRIAAVDDLDPQTRGPAQCRDLLGHLECELTSGGQDHGLNGHLLQIHELDDGDPEGRRLARARARLHDEIPAGQGLRNGLGLDVGRRDVALGLDALSRRCGEGHGGEALLLRRCRFRCRFHQPIIMGPRSPRGKKGAGNAMIRGLPEVLDAPHLLPMRPDGRATRPDPCRLPGTGREGSGALVYLRHLLRAMGRRRGAGHQRVSPEPRRPRRPAPARGSRSRVPLRRREWTPRRMIHIEGLSKRYGDRILFEDVGWHVRKQDRIGLAGPNGAGKTTILRMLAGLEEPDSGQIRMASDTTIGYLPQDGIVHSGRTVREEVVTAFEEILALKAEQHDIEDALEQTSHDDSAGHEKLLERYAEITERFKHLGGWEIDARIADVLKGLGFSPTDEGRRTEEFSGGWQMRIALAKLLLARPNLLLMDEPTNHLDLPARNWLEEYLSDYPGSVVLVSHDRYFLDATVKRITQVGLQDPHRLPRQLLPLRRRARRAHGGPARSVAPPDRGDREDPGLHQPLPLPGHQGEAGSEPDQDARQGRAHRDPP